MEIRWNNIPSKVVVDKIGNTQLAFDALNKELDQDCKIQMLPNKYLNKKVEQDHRFIKKQIKPMLGFEGFHATSITIKGIANTSIMQEGKIIYKSIATVSELKNKYLLLTTSSDLWRHNNQILR